MARRVRFAEAVGSGFRKYFQFSGRAQRAEFWWWIAFWCLGSLVAVVLDRALDLGPSQPLDGVITIRFLSIFEWSEPAESVFKLFVLTPTAAVGVRRLHDIGKRGWWLLMPFAILFGTLMAAPFIGAARPVVALAGPFGFLAVFVVILVWWARDGDRGSNRFGPSPKYGSEMAVFD